jgi:23S rRNA pseudouridine1911/1915/1917 synthase
VPPVNLPEITVYRDQWLLVVNKPAGILVVPTPKNEHHTLTNRINEYLAAQGESIKAHPCHRLDRDTSGLIVYALGKAAQKKMMELFHARRVSKYYQAFVQGHLTRSQGVMNQPLEKKPALTKYKVLHRRKNFSIIEFQPVTGRTNQIRLHCVMAGHPLVGERRFAFAKDFALKFRRPCLHALRLEFEHPMTGAALAFEAPLAADMQEFLSKEQ